jgi:peptidoglycan/xylan/chitin deacetylase (PgdA/CDA1 family)
MSKQTLRNFAKRHKVKLTGTALILAVVAMFAAVNNPAVVGVSAATRKLPIYCVQRDQKLVSLSFDAAWGNEDTQQLIDILAKYNVKATFFVVGMWVDKYPESVKALSEAGHEVMNHSSTHPHCSKLSSEQIAAELNACNDKVEAVTGVRPTLFRAPYGEYDDHVITEVEKLGMHTIQWDVETNGILLL